MARVLVLVAPSPMAHQPQMDRTELAQQRNPRAGRASRPSPANGKGIAAPLFAFLDLPMDLQIRVLCFLTPEEIHTCGRANKYTWNLITSDWPWRDKFFRDFRGSPVVTMGRSWCSEYTRRFDLWEKLAGHILQPYTTRVRAVASMFVDAAHELVLSDAAQGLVLRYQLANGRVTQVGRHASRIGDTLCMDADPLRTAFASHRRVCFLMGNRGGASYRQVDRNLDVPPVIVKWAADPARPRACVVALASTQLEYFDMDANPIVQLQSPRLANTSIPGVSALCVTQAHCTLAAVRDSVFILDTPGGPNPEWGAPRVWHSPAAAAAAAVDGEPAGYMGTEEPVGDIDAVMYNCQLHPHAFVRLRSQPNLVFVVNVVDAETVCTLEHDAAVTSWTWHAGPGVNTLAAPAPTADEVPPAESAEPVPESSLDPSPPLPPAAADPERPPATPPRTKPTNGRRSPAPPRPPVAPEDMLAVLVTGDADGSVRMWSAASTSPRGTLLRHLRSQQGSVAALYADAGCVLSATPAGWVLVWDPVSGECRRRIQARARDNEEPVAFIAKGSRQTDHRIYLGFRSGAVKVIEPRTRRTRRKHFRAAQAEAAANGGRSSGNGSGSRINSSTNIYADIEDELTDLSHRQVELDRLQTHAKRINGTAELTEAEMLQLALSLSHDADWEPWPGDVDVDVDVDVDASFVSSSSGAAGHEDEDASLAAALALIERDNLPPAITPVRPPTPPPAPLSGAVVEEWNLGISEEEALRFALEQSLLDQ
ncbi:hypothetical protein H9P43_000351 [Blastocladiella emersonii ATCC 22665]|nr:hypothetical protein H9P43_000351 [Blastocladiella emersonii ATCC 22665]